MNQERQGKPAPNSELVKLADHGLAQAKAQIELQGHMHPIFIVRDKTGQLHPLKLPPGTERLMNDGDFKDHLFGAIRQVVEKSGATATVFITDGWFYPPTAKMLALDLDGRKALQDNHGPPWLFANGYVDRIEMMVCTVQTAERTLIRQVPYTRTRFGVMLHAPEDWEMPEYDFGGRQVHQLPEDTEPWADSPMARARYDMAVEHLKRTGQRV